MLRARRVGLLLILLGVILFAIWTVRLAQAGQSLWGHLAQLEDLADSPEAMDLITACDLARGLRSDVVALQTEGGGLVWLAPALGWLPEVGGDLRSAPHLLIVADGLSEAGSLACNALGPALAIVSGTGGASDGLSLAQMTNLLSEQQADLKQALAAVERAQAAWKRIDVAGLSPRLAGKAVLLERGLPFLQAGLKALTVAPDLLGVNEARTYLILALNEDELRPGGGFITSVGEIQLERGQLAKMTFRDSYAVDDFTQPYPDPPEPLYRFMKIDQWVFRDSNWSPDFPTAARQAISLYRPGYPVRVDGVIALDQRALQELVGALGPLTVEGAEEAVTGGNVIAQIRRAWAPKDGALTREWWQQRKSFMGPLAEAIWKQVEQGRVDRIAIAKALVRLLEEKHLLIYLQHPDAAALLAEQGWDGALRSGSGDFLMVVDANLGYNKANPRIQQAITYQVDLRSSPPQATLMLVYTHTSSVSIPCRPEIRYDPVYEQAMDRCYWNYLRVYVPQGSQLLDATRIPVPGQALFSGREESGAVAIRSAEEGPWLVLETLALLPPLTTQTRLFRLTLPANVIQWQGDEGWYSLRIQKQPGAPSHSLTVLVRLPGGGVLLKATPTPSAAGEGWAEYRLLLDRDREFRIHFRRQR